MPRKQDHTLDRQILGNLMLYLLLLREDRKIIPGDLDEEFTTSILTKLGGAGVPLVLGPGDPHRRVPKYGVPMVFGWGRNLENRPLAHPEVQCLS